MFRASLCSSSGGQFVYLQYLVSSRSVCCHPVHRLRADWQVWVKHDKHLRLLTSPDAAYGCNSVHLVRIRLSVIEYIFGWGKPPRRAFLTWFIVFILTLSYISSFSPWLCFIILSTCVNKLLPLQNRQNGTTRITKNTRDKGRKDEYVERM
jgi:hypothetical protein